MRTGPSPVLRLLAGTVLISFAPVLVLLAGISPTSSAVARCAISAAVLALAAALRTGPAPSAPAPRGLLLATGAVFALDIFCYHRAIAGAGAGISTILGNTQVFYSALVGILLFKEGASKRFLASVPAAFLGIFLLVGWSGSPDPDTFRRGTAFGIVVGPAYAAFLLLLKRLRQGRGGDAIEGDLAAVLASSAVFLALALPFDGGWSPPFAAGWLWLLLLGAGPGAAGWVLISGSLDEVPISRAGLVLLLQPVLASLWGMLLFAEPWSAPQAAGAVLTLLAVYLGMTARPQPSP